MNVTDLYADLYADQGTDDGSGPGEFTVRDLRSADWAVRKIAGHRRRLSAAEDLARAESAHVAEWLARQRHSCTEACAWLADQLECWHRAAVDVDAAGKTVDLPSGTLRLRRYPYRFELDEPTFVAWAARNAPGLVRVREEPDRTAVRTALRVTSEGTVVDTDGELVPGVTVVPAETRFTISTDDR